MFKVYYRILGAAWKNYGLGLRFWGWLLLLPLFLLFTHFTLFLDKIFFPQYQHIKIKNPIFILGNPRSGTSFLHRLLTETREFAAFETWQIFFPSLTVRTLIKPIVDYLVRTNRTQIIPEETGHGFYLNAVEHDEFLFIHKLDTQFILLLSPLAFDDQESPELCFYDQQPQSRRHSSVNFLKECFQRQIYSTGNEQVICHAHFSTCRIQTLLEAFPDAKFIYLVRSPYETIPSHFTLEYNTFEDQNRIDNMAPEKIQRYFERRYDIDIKLYRYFYELHKNQIIPPEQVMVLSYDELSSSLDKAVEKVVDFTGIKLSDELRQAIAKQSEKQKNYKRKHKIISVSEKFNLTKEQIAQDFAFVFEEYGFDKNLGEEANISVTKE